MTNWPILPLREVGDIAQGITLGRKTRRADLVPVPYLRVANVQDGRLDMREIKMIKATSGEAEKWRLRAGDLLLTEGGDLDKLGRGTCWQDELPLCIHQNHIFRVRLPFERYDPEFVSLQFGSGYGKAYFLTHAKKTTGIATINQRVLGDFPLLSPPVDQQRRISTRLKAQLATVDEARQAAQTQSANAQKLAAAILREAFEAIADRKTVTIGEVAETCSGTTPSRDRKDYWTPATIPWVKTGEVAFAAIHRTEEQVSPLAAAECSLPLLPPGTVLVAMYGQGKTRGQSAVLQIEATTNQACFAILPNDTFEPEYLQFWLHHSYRSLREDSADRGGNQSNLNGGMLNAFEVPLIARETQHALVKKIKNALAAADSLRSALATRLSEIERLPAHLLAQVFGNA